MIGYSVPVALLPYLGQLWSSLLDEHAFQRKDALNVRGNAWSFPLPWDGIASKLKQVVDGEVLWDELPYSGAHLAKTVLFSLRIGNVTDLEKWLPAARLRPHVVLKLLFNLVDRKYPFNGKDRNIQRIKQELQARLDSLFPEQEADISEEDRQGSIPPEVLKAIKAAMGDPEKQKNTGIQQKHATPADAPDNMDVILESLRPNIVNNDRDSMQLEDPNRKAKHALRAFASRHPAVLKVCTGTELVDQWNWNFLPLAFPYSLPRVVGGADYPLAKRVRRDSAAAVLDPWDHLVMHARRVESNIKTDWTLVPSQRNIVTRHEALCGDSVACKHKVEDGKAGAVLAAELLTAVESLYKKLINGKYTDENGNLRSINKDTQTAAFRDRVGCGLFYAV